MSDNEPIEVEIHNHFKEKDPGILSITELPEFQEFLQSLDEAAESGESLANLIATMVMTIFGPSFVMIGSPDLETDENGYSAPSEVGVCLAASSDMTPSNLAYLLRKLSIALDNDIDATMETLKNDNN